MRRPLACLALALVTMLPVVGTAAAVEPTPRPITPQVEPSAVLGKMFQPGRIEVEWLGIGGFFRSLVEKRLAQKTRLAEEKPERSMASVR